MPVFAICGPSGAGKDTLIAAAVQACPDIHVVRRIITRDAAAGGEDFTPATDAAFDELVSNQGLVVHWQAHGLRYGIPNSALAAAQTGKTVLFNASRAMLREADRVFGGIVVLWITASPQVLAQRLAARGRESGDDLRERLARASAFHIPAGLPVVKISNDGDIETATRAVIQALYPDRDPGTSDLPNPPTIASRHAPMTQTILSRAQIALPEDIITGSIVMENGVIADIVPGDAVLPDAIDCNGDLVMPGLIELHTDNLERHLEPRPHVMWPREAALIAHDAELSGVGITTVFDALRVGAMRRADGNEAKYAREIVTLLGDLRAKGALRISHRVHLRAEVCSETLLEELEEFTADDRIGIVSMMDHTPGQRQFRDVSKYEIYTRNKRGMSAEDFQNHVDKLMALRAGLGDRHEIAISDFVRATGATLASHDDTDHGQVLQSAAYGARVAEFPTTFEAAEACRDAGIKIMMGAPNLIRGGSHSGNISAKDLARSDLLDIVSSDYVPAALLTSALLLGDIWDDLPRGLRTVTATPAEAVGLTDRGRIARGLRADVIRVRRLGDITARLCGTWVAGERVA